MVPKNKALVNFGEALDALMVKVDLDKVVAVATRSSTTGSPKTTLMHVRLNENKANVDSLCLFLWHKASLYALAMRRRIELQEQIASAPKGDISAAATITNAVRDAFLEFRKKYPNRASEVGEVLAYCIATSELQAPQLLAKLALKTNNNMPVHGLDGIHAKVANGFLNLYFLESKLAKSANDGASDYAESVAEFSNNKKQYRREYSLVRDFGNLDSLEPANRKIALDYFDVLSSPTKVPKRERYIGVILYSDSKLFSGLSAIDDSQPPGFHEAELVATYTKHLKQHQGAALRHLKKHEADENTCQVFFVVVPDVDAVREGFYQAMGYTEP